MSRADDLQMNHRLQQAIEARRADINNGHSDWHNFHQLGVLISEWAETAWLRGQEETSYSLLRQAIGNFDLAARIVPQDRVGLAAITCDMAMARARISRLGCVEEFDAALAELTGVVAILTNKQDAAARHQLAIAHAFLARLHFGELLGFPADDNPEEVNRHFNKAQDLFWRETTSPAGTPDRRQAECSLLLHMALGYWYAPNGRMMARTLATRAYSVAADYKDRRRMIRAIVIRHFGPRGDRRLRLWRDRKL